MDQEGRRDLGEADRSGRTLSRSWPAAVNEGLILIGDDGNIVVTERGEVYLAWEVFRA